jgi:hypothetical protein
MECSRGCAEAVCPWKSRTFEATRGPERLGLAPGVCVDHAGQKHAVARRSKAEDVGKVRSALAISSGLARACQLVVVGDGAAWIWRLVAEHVPQAVQIVDIWHVREPIGKGARAVFVPGSPQACAWADHACGEPGSRQDRGSGWGDRRLTACPTRAGGLAHYAGDRTGLLHQHCRSHALSNVSGPGHACGQWHC